MKLLSKQNRFAVWTLLVSVSIAGLLLLVIRALPGRDMAERRYGPVLHEETSAFSKIRVRGDTSNRHLFFVSETGTEALQSSVDLENPSRLQVAYTEALFCAHLFHHPPKRILIVGLGGGGMVRFAEQHLPDTMIEAVEIDPAVVAIAEDFFQTKTSERVLLHTEDAFRFLANPENGSFDIIYMDAFLKPSVDGDADGKTGRLKTVAFLQTIRERLTPEGVLACNLIENRASTPEDLKALQQVFPSVVILPVKETGNLGVFGLSHAFQGESAAPWITRSRDLSVRWDVDIPFEEHAQKIYVSNPLEEK